MISIEEMATFCKKKGFVFRTSDIYGGFAGFFDFGPLGVELKNNVKQSLWKRFVQQNSLIVGMDGAIISHPKVWKSSGHTDCFTDVMVVSEKSKNKYRADQIIEDSLKIPTEGMKKEELLTLIQEHKLTDPKTGETLLPAQDFNLMFTTTVGASKKAPPAYLRPETAQLIFSNFRSVMDTARKKLPFGIAQIGKAFRNEISPRDFLFRTREFEQFELEFFVHPKKKDDCPPYDSVKYFKVNLFSADHQKNKKNHEEYPLDELVKKNIIKSPWHGYWLVQFYQYFIDYGIKKEHLRLREHLKTELAHYASACFDIEYHFPFGWKEIHGNADRGSFDLTQHMKSTKADLSVFDEESKEKIIPLVLSEPSQGIERAMLAFLFEAYHNDEKRGNIVLSLHPALSPIKVGVFPLVNKLEGDAQKLFSTIQNHFTSTYDKSGSIGRRYARADEIGIPYCITIDFDTQKDSTVTIRDRNTTNQIRISQDQLIHTLGDLLSQRISFTEVKQKT